MHANNRLRNRRPLLQPARLSRKPIRQLRQPQEQSHHAYSPCNSDAKLPHQIAYAESVSLNWKSGELAEGLGCYRRAEFFLAHEHWEIVWLKLDEPEKSFLQALIQTTAAFHHLQTGNSTGAASRLKRALRRLELCPELFAGIAVTPLCTQISDWVRALESTSPSIPPAFPQICLTD